MSDRRIPIEATVCEQSHGGPDNAATFYGHHGRSDVCVRVGQSDTWVHSIGWAGEGNPSPGDLCYSHKVGDETYIVHVDPCSLAGKTTNDKGKVVLL